MVKLISLFLMLFSHLVHGANLSLELNNSHVEMGKHLIATFTYEGNSKPEPIDLDLWNDDFYIELADADLSATEFGGIISTTRAKIYPRHTGSVTLDAIALGGSFVKPQSINVLPSVRNNIDATPLILPLKSHYWADQAIIININVPLHFKRNQVIAKEWLSNKFTITALPSIKTANNVQLRWMIYTPYKGDYALELPTIVQRGRGRFRFHLPTLKFNVKPLPAYLPSSVASGQLNISSKIQHIKGKKIATITLKKLAYLPKQIEGLQTFFNFLDHDQMNISEQQSSKNGITTRHYQFNVATGLWRKKLNIKLSFFNTQTGRLDTIQHQLESVTTLSKNTLYTLIALSLLAFALVLKLANNVAIKIRKKRAFKENIKHSKTAQQLRALLLNKQYKTLTQWAYDSNTQSSVIIAKNLNIACYQVNSPHSLTHLKQLMTSL